MDAPLNYAFASDNTSGIHPEVLNAVLEVNCGRCASYGDDEATAQAADAFREIFECDCDVYFVFTGTAANSLALATLCQSYHSVITHEFSHVETDECGAPEFFSNGTKLLTIPGALGKMNAMGIEHVVNKRRDIHYPKPKAVTLSCPTELGTVYTPEEITDVSRTAHQYGLRVHMDGARFANAVASLGVAPAELTWRAGVDVLSFGGTKLGCIASEAVVFFKRELGEEFAYRCKQAGQLGSKMRFLTAAWPALFRGGRWLEIAAHANAMARRLREGLERIEGVTPLHQTQANAVFASLPEHVHAALRSAGWRYYVFIGGGARFMCSWSTAPEEVDALLEAVRVSI
jgi:threonine aldolase